MARLSVTGSLTTEARALSRRREGRARGAREGPLHGRAAGGRRGRPPDDRGVNPRTLSRIEKFRILPVF